MTLKEWLRTPCLEEDATVWQYNTLENGGPVLYLDIDKVREKIRYMEDTFAVSVNFYDMTVVAHNGYDKDTTYTGSIRLEIVSDNGSCLKSLCGSTSFSVGQFTKTKKYGAIAKSLATVNALSTEYEQFGKLLNKEDVVSEMGTSKSAGPNRLANSIKQYGKK